MLLVRVIRVFMSLTSSAGPSISLFHPPQSERPKYARRQDLRDSCGVIHLLYMSNQPTGILATRVRQSSQRFGLSVCGRALTT